MKSKGPQPQSEEDSSGEINLSPEQQQFLEQLVKDRDTDENLKKLGQSLGKAWKKPADKPDLSFEKFEQKLRRKDQ